MEENKTIIEYLQELIEEYKNEIDILSNSLPTVYEENKNILTLVIDDINNIVKIDFNKIEILLSEVIEDKKTREDLLENMKIIETLLKLNVEKKTTYRLSIEQLQYINTFLRNISLIIRKNEEEKEEKRNEKEKLRNICNKYIELLDILTNPNNDKIITDIKLIELLLQDTDLSTTERRKIIINILKKNQTTYENILTNKIVKKELKDSEIIPIFEKYGYDYNLLNQEDKEYLKEYLDKDELKEKLSIWVNNTFPIINLEEEGSLFTHILIRLKINDLETLIKIKEEELLNTLDLYELLSLLLIDTTTDKELSRKINNIYKNTKYLNDNNYNIEEIFNNNKMILWINNNLLIKNIKILKDYDLLKDTLNIEILSIIDIENIEEIIDQFIEISNNTYNYLKQNPSIIRDLSENKRLIYSIYNEEHNNNLVGAFLEKDNKLILKNNLEDSEYLGYIHEFENKLSYARIMKDYDKIDEFKYQPIEKLIEYIDIDNPLLYNINSILISRLKTERIYELLVENNTLLNDSLLYALTYNKLLTEEDFYEIEKMIMKEE